MFQNASIFKVEKTQPDKCYINSENSYKFHTLYAIPLDLEDNTNLKGEDEWLIRASYILSRNSSIQANYNNLYGWVCGLSVRF